MMTLRPYQQEALDAVITDMLKQPDVLLQAATGAGKTIIFSSLIKTLLERYPAMRIGVLAHREQLIRQAASKLISVWPEGMHLVGIACKSVANKCDLENSVVIGSPQTLIRRVGEMPPIQLLIIDECHRLPPRTASDSMYVKLIDKFRSYYPSMRLLGVTATPFRLGHGYIYGDQCVRIEENWFSKLSYTISIKTLIEHGFLVPYTIMVCDNPDLSDVHKRGSEFIEHELAETMKTAIHLDSAVSAIKKYAEDRCHIVVFAVTIEHAKLLCERFQENGFTSTIIHSKLPHEERMKALSDFESGKCRIICNVNVLTEGWDCTCVDCMVMCKPTMSTALYIQMIGRGLRVHPGKKDCLVLDLSGNYDCHGEPDEPEVHYGKGDGSGAEKDEPEGGVYQCPYCSNEISPQKIICPYCGADLKVTCNEEVSMVEIGKRKYLIQQFTTDALVIKSELNRFTSKKGNDMIRLSLVCIPSGQNLPVYVNEFLDVEGNAGDWSRGKAITLWKKLSNNIGYVPSTIEDALSHQDYLHIPRYITITKKGKYWNVQQWKSQNYGNPTTVSNS